MNQTFSSANDFRKSLESRLKNLSLKNSIDLQRLRKKVAFDRFLARVFLEKEPQFFLKGGYAMELRLTVARATKDVDLTYSGRGDPNMLTQLLLRDLRALAKRNLNDFFEYRIGEAQIDLNNAPYGGARFPVLSSIDGKEFVKFQLDVGADAIVDNTELLIGNDWLGFCGISNPYFVTISIEQQFAEKLHAYTQPRVDRINTRVKDLIDMILLIQMRPANLNALKNIVNRVFKIRNTHPVPEKIDPPPPEWEDPFNELANECALSFSLTEAFYKIRDLYQLIIEEKVS